MKPPMKNVLAALETARAAGALRDVDLHLARHLLALDARPVPEVALAIAALSRANADGNVCLDLAAVAGTRLFAGDHGYPGIPAPACDAWLGALRASVLVATAAAAAPTQTAPLVLDDQGRLYLQKYFAFERAIVDDITARVGAPCAVAEAALQAALAQCFAGREPGDTQMLAAATAARHPFAVITGGPGTGKTTTVTRLLAVLLMLAGDRPLRIALAAPTGKAAARLGDSIGKAVAELRRSGLDEALLARIPAEASTLHRLLGWQPGNGFRHHAGNPLPVDLLVIDEASMIDLSLMARLLAAVPRTARLVLLGDRDQLASVEAGNVLGDLCNHGDTATPDGDARADAAPIARSIAVLTRSHRYPEHSGIGVLARATNAGAVDAALATFGQHPDTTALRAVPASALATQVADEVTRHLADYRRQPDPAAAIKAFDGFRFLCALRDGPFGVEAINRLAERALEQAGLIDVRQRHYAGRPLLITQNDYGVQLFNGDTGLVLPDGNGVLRAFFRQGDDQTVRQVALNRLPAHETCYAMTVHKSQGSEFGQVVLVLPEVDSPVLTRELVYTGITRAKSAVTVWAQPARLATAIACQVRRSSGLRDALWGPAPPQDEPRD